MSTLNTDLPTPIHGSMARASRAGRARESDKKDEELRTIVRERP
jgi:hypothetical protein